MATKTFIYKNNTGGSNLRSNEANINAIEQRTEFTLIQNMEIYREGGLASQLGNTQLNTGVTDTTVVTGIGEFKSGNNTYIMYTKASGNAYALDHAGGAEGSPIKTGLNASATPQFITYNGKSIAFNGQDMPWSWPGSGSASNLTGTPASWSTTKPSTAAVFGGKRIFALAGQEIDYCALGNENDWTTSNDAGSIKNLFQDTTQLTAIADYGTRLAIHSASPAIYLLSGSQPSDYAAAPIASNRSATGKKAIATINDMQFFFSGDSILPVITTDLGVIKLGKDNEISFKIKPFLTGTETELLINPIIPAQNSSVMLIPYYSKNYLLAYFKTTGNNYFDTAAIYNFDSNNWVFRQATPISAAALVGGNVITGTPDGRILQEFVGTTVVSGSFIKRLVSPWYDFGAPDRKKRITRMYIWFKSTTDINVSVQFKTDYSTDTKVTRPITTDGTSSGASYGFGDYGVDSFAASGFTFESFPLNLEGRSFQFDMSSATSTVDFRIVAYGFEVEYLDAY